MACPEPVKGGIEVDPDPTASKMKLESYPVSIAFPLSSLTGTEEEVCHANIRSYGYSR
jgi:hypothetical protein